MDKEKIFKKWLKEYREEEDKTEKDKKKYMREYQREYAKTPKQREYRREYAMTPKQKEYQREYRRTIKYREWEKEYRKSQKYKEYHREYSKTPKQREKAQKHRYKRYHIDEFFKHKSKIRALTNQKYGKLPRGFQYHHTTTPYEVDKFIVVTKEDHKRIHEKTNPTLTAWKTNVSSGEKILTQTTFNTNRFLDPSPVIFKKSTGIVFEKECKFKGLNHIGELKYA